VEPGAPDAAVTDAGATDGGAVEADAGAGDAGASDAGVDAGRPDAGPGPFVIDGGVVYSFGPELLPAVRASVTAHVLELAPQAVEIAADVEAVLAQGAVHLAFGHSAPATRLGSEAEVASLTDDEAFVLQSEVTPGGTRLMAVGAPGQSRAAAYGAYALLEEVGFAFLHPLSPWHAPALRLPALPLHRAEAPRWKTRTIHLHTQHPLELTELLQGWGPGGVLDAAGWAAQLPEWDRYLEWLLANRQNGVEWFLLWADSWSTFADGPERFLRLSILVQHAHAFGLAAGLDVPIVFGQQHAFRLLRNQQASNEPAELAELRGRVDQVLDAGFDFLGTESGTSEFTAPDPQRMLDWMNAVTDEAAVQGHHPVYIKAHASAGQQATGFVDPTDGGVLNFNFLPHYADARLGVLPHTVQPYGLDDPAPVYGNTDFGYLEDFLRMETGRRPVLWYPESAYWVSVDVDVPLFLPLYAERRLADLRRLAADEDANRMAVPGARMSGQLLFSSGWEWGYWLNDVVAARGAWQPSVGQSDAQAWATALAPVVRPFGPQAAAVATWLHDVASAEHALLIFGEVNGVRPQTIAQRNGYGYLVAWDTWDDIAKTTGLMPFTQPDKLGLVDMRNPLHGGPGYTAEVDPLLAAMQSQFADLAARGEVLRASVPAESTALFDELADAMQVTALRARQVHGLYQYVDGYWSLNQAPRLAALADARAALDAAQLLVTRREAHFRVPLDRITGWRDNPTAYPFTYLWMAHTLYGWWRDEGKAVDAPISPCYLNVINPVDVAFGEGMGTDAARLIGSALSADQQRGCLAEPTQAPTFPQDDLRSRP
jgi:hypothetical protein